MFLAALYRTSQPHFPFSKQKKAIQHLSVWSRISGGTWMVTIEQIILPPHPPAQTETGSWQAGYWSRWKLRLWITTVV